jgi:hypothetical protein
MVSFSSSGESVRTSRSTSTRSACMPGARDPIQSCSAPKYVSVYGSPILPVMGAPQSFAAYLKGGSWSGSAESVFWRAQERNSILEHMPSTPCCCIRSAVLSRPIGAQHDAPLKPSARKATAAPMLPDVLGEDQVLLKRGLVFSEPAGSGSLDINDAR